MRFALPPSRSRCVTVVALAALALATSTARAGAPPSTGASDHLRTTPRPPSNAADAHAHRLFHGAMGLTDDAWAGVIQLIGLAVCFALGLTGLTGRSLAYEIAFALVVNVFAQLLIAGGGPGAAAGFVVLPIAYALASLLGRGIGSIAWTRLRRGRRTPAVA